MPIIFNNTTPKLMQIVLDWANIGATTVSGGTPISAAGRIANNKNAIGILPYTVGLTDPSRAVDLIVSGILSLPDVQSSSGLVLSGACKAALDEIAFVKADGTYDTASSITMDAVDDEIDGKLETALADYTPTADLGSVVYEGIILHSQTAESTKNFLVTVVDDGTLTATEIVPPENDGE